MPIFPLNYNILISATCVWFIMTGVYAVLHQMHYFREYILRYLITDHNVDMDAATARNRASLLAVLCVNVVILYLYFNLKKNRHNRYIRYIRDIVLQQIDEDNDNSNDENTEDGEEDGDDDDHMSLLQHESILESPWRTMTTMTTLGIYWALLTAVYHYVLSPLVLEPVLLQWTYRNYDNFRTDYLVHHSTLMWTIMLLIQFMFPILIGRMIMQQSEQVDTLEAQLKRSRSRSGGAGGHYTGRKQLHTLHSDGGDVGDDYDDDASSPRTPISPSPSSSSLSMSILSSSSSSSSSLLATNGGGGGGGGGGAPAAIQRRTVKQRE